jgi:iron complex transport system substrate-binding protein
MPVIFTHRAGTGFDPASHDSTDAPTGTATGTPSGNAGEPDPSATRPTRPGPTRRGVLLGAGAAFAALATGPRPGCARAQAPAAPRVVAHRFGETVAPADPRRVVTVGFTDQDPVLALGVVPVAARAWLGSDAIWPWAADAVGDAAPENLPADAVAFERIAALRPDLILGISAAMTEDEYATLSAIAPTVAPPAGYPDFGVPWQEQARIVGRALGRGAAAEDAVAAVEARFAAARADHPAFVGATAAAAYSFAPSEYGVYGPDDARARVLAALGFVLPAALADLAGGAFFAPISRERLDLLDVDVLVWILAAEGDRAALEGDPLYARLPVATEGRAIVLDEDDVLQPALSFGTVLSLPFALDRLVPRLDAAVDGDPATAAAAAA